MNKEIKIIPYYFLYIGDIICYFYMVISMHHHICNTLWSFPPKKQLQSALENYTAISSPLLRDKKITEIFANGLAERIRSPKALRMNIHLLLIMHESEIGTENRKAIDRLYNKVLRDIAIPHPSR